MIIIIAIIVIILIASFSKQKDAPKNHSKSPRQPSLEAQLRQTGWKPKTYTRKLTQHWNWNEIFTIAQSLNHNIKTERQYFNLPKQQRDRILAIWKQNHGIQINPKEQATFILNSTINTNSQRRKS